MLCEICVKALSHFQIRAQFCPHHGSLESLSSSVQFGCYICCSLWHHLFGQYTRDGELSSSGRYDFSLMSKAAWRDSVNTTGSSTSLTDVHASNETLLFTKSYSSFRKINLSRLRVLTDDRGLSCIAVWITGAELWESLFTFVPIEIMTGSLPDQGTLLLEDIERSSTKSISEDQLNLLQTWLRVCVTSHTSCNQLDQELAWLPTRLIDVSKPGSVSLVETASRHMRGKQYCTLSHRWKSSSPFISKLSNTAELREGISIMRLPKTYQQAIHVAREFGIDYIWIDSLCIIQDDESDWLSEAPNMDRVYEHSLVNLSATGAQTSDEGLFFESQRNVAPPCASNDFWHLRPFGTCLVISNMMWNEEVDSAPLNSRAWVLQERLLAPRVLHFGRQQVFWECNTCVRSQQFREGIPRVLITGDDRHFLRRDQLYASGQSREAQSVAWLTVVERYSGCDLTFPEDKLLAIAGLARSFSNVFGNGYHAGLWRSQLCHHLLWQTAGLSRSSSRPLVYRAPSWSWAAIDGAITYQSKSWSSSSSPELDIELLEVIDVKSENVTEDCFGPCLFAKIVLSGHLLAVRPDYEGSFSPVSFTFEFIQLPSLRFERMVAYPDVPFDEDELKERYQILPTLYHVDTDDRVRIFGLLLESAVLRQPVYRRIGLVDMSVSLPYERNGITDFMFYREEGNRSTINLI